MPFLIQKYNTNNALVFRPFSSEELRPELHSTSYKCVASNSFGTISSRLVQVRACKY